MTEDFQLRTDPRTAADMHRVMHALAAQHDIESNRIKALRIIKRSIDARQRNVMVNLTVRCWLDEEPATIALYEPIRYGDVSSSEKRAVVVGAGPGGLFAALRLIEAGVKPVLLERGKNVDERRLDIAKISREGTVNPDSNYCFGEGGAGAYSD